ncbi:MAG: glycosyltransferase [Roseburia sp.]|nr:glycosyltransferase [Roseburia sp.]MCM1097978.1 glycosyltransferase [Ruminococcus flavefaciens]
MKLSIIVPVYNMMAENKLKNCLDSLVKQDVEDLEIIAVDDKSTDDSLALLKSYSERYGRRFVTVASSVNLRQGGAKNLGLQKACGQWIGFVDSDDWVAGDMFSSLLKKAEETGADVVGCDYLLTDEIGKETGTVCRNNTADQTGRLGDAQYKKLLLNPGSMVIKIYRRQLFEEQKIRFPEGIFYEDNAVAALPLLYASRFERVDRPLYFYYQHSGSTVHKTDLDRCEDRMKAMEIYKEELKQRGFYEKYREEILYKVMELGYKITLFSYLQTAALPSLTFIRRLRSYLLAQAPDYADNPYYQQYTDAENKRLIALHVKCPVLFLLYYKLLQGYRRIRYGSKKGN